MPKMVAKDRWILYKHTCNYEIIKAIALDVKNNCRADISNEERTRMQERQAALNLYKTRNPHDKPLDSMNHRINTLEYFMLGYESKVAGNNQFIFSPLGNLFLDRTGKPEIQRKIFIAMLFGMQLQHPANGTPKCFQLFPFRLIFKLLTDSRLLGRLYSYEYACLIAFTKEICDASYEALVNNMLVLRNKPSLEIASLAKADEHTYVNNVHEWSYMRSFLSEIGIMLETQGNVLCKLVHPPKTNSKSKPTSRPLTDGYIEISSSEVDFITRMLTQHDFRQKPLLLDDAERLKIDVIKEIYSFYPRELLVEIGENVDEQFELLELPKLIEMYANNPENKTAYLFEDVLAKGMNMFSNVEATRIGGADNTDIECLYLTLKKKFAVDAKSTANKLLGINAGRMRAHREDIGGEYTIIVTPRYVPAAKRDIVGTPNVIILANTFAEYLYNHIYHDVRDIDYKDFDDIIISNLGTDVSKQISDLTLQKFAAVC